MIVALRSAARATSLNNLPLMGSSSGSAATEVNDFAASVNDVIRPPSARTVSESLLLGSGQ